jgi:outer membrane protein
MKRRILLLIGAGLMSVAMAQELRTLNLEDAITIARESSPGIRQARLNLERSRELLNAQNARLKSQFSLTLQPFAFRRAREFNPFFSTWNTSESKSSTGELSIVQPLVWTDGILALRNQTTWQDAYTEYNDTRTRTYANNLYLTYDQPLFTYNRTRLELEAVRLDLRNNSLSYQLQEFNLELSVTRGFYNVYRLKMALQINVEEMNNTEQSMRIIQNKVDAGLAAQEELYQAELNLMSSKSNVENSRVSLENALDDFKQLIGMPLESEISVIADIADTPVQVDQGKALDHGLATRLELRQRKINIESSRADVVRAEATNEFKGNMRLSVGLIGNNEKLQQVYETPTENQDVSIAFDIPIWDWGEQESRTRAANATLQVSQLSMEEERKSIKMAIRRAYRNLVNQRSQIDIARQNVKVAQLTYDINLERFENGDLTSMDLNLFQNQLTQKKNGLIEAMINYKLALLDMKIESLWDFEMNQPVLNPSAENEED